MPVLLMDFVAERMSEGKATTVEREWVVVVVKE